MEDKKIHGSLLMELVRMKKNTFAIVGGDSRSVLLADALKKRGNQVYTLFNSENISDHLHPVLPLCDVVILPLPMLDCAGNLNTPLSDISITPAQFLPYIKKDATILAGKVPVDPAFDGIIDYLEREEFSVYNAALTAEAAIEIALKELPISLMGSTCVITGYGRIAKALAKNLDGFSANTRIVTHKHCETAWAKTAGFAVFPFTDIAGALTDADIVFNTVPSVVLGHDELEKLSPECLVVDLASYPGGVDFSAANKLQRKTIHALALPGKTAPIAAAGIMLDTIMNILTERLDTQ